MTRYAKYIPEDGRFAFSTEDLGGVELTDEYFYALFEGQSTGKIIVPDADGYPILADPPPPPFSQVSETYLKEVHELRERMLNRLSWIGFTMLSDGDNAKAAIVRTAGEGLIAITTSVEVVSATTGEELRTAVKTQYKAIADNAPEWLRSAFNEIDL